MSRAAPTIEGRRRALEAEQSPIPLVADEVLPALDFDVPMIAFDEYMPEGYVLVANAIDNALETARRFLGETSVPIGVNRLRPRCKMSQEQAGDKVATWFTTLLSLWFEVVNEKDDRYIVAFFNDLLQRCASLYNNTVAYTTVSKMVTAALTVIPTTGRAGHPTLSLVKLHLKLLPMDIKVFQALNCGSYDIVIEAAAAARDLIRSAGVVEQPQEDWCAATHKQLAGELRILEEVYAGIAEAAEALREHDLLVKLAVCDEPHGHGYNLPSPHASNLRMCAKADSIRSRLQTIELIEHDLAMSAGSPIDLSSRLRPWEQVLRVIATYDPDETLQFVDVNVHYYFPFVVDLSDERFRALDNHLVERPPWRQRPPIETQGKGGGARARKARAVLSKLSEDLHGTFEALPLTELWEGAGDGLYGGIKIKLPELHTGTADEEPCSAWVQLSRLRNHCVCVKRHLKAPTPHELSTALRDVAHYASTSEYRFEQTGVEGGAWRSVEDFAHDVVLTVARALTGDEPLNPDSFFRRHFHEVVSLYTREQLGCTDVDIGNNLARRYGGKLCLANIHRVAGTLDEWIRYPIPEKKEVRQFRLGYEGEWVAMLSDTTVFGLVSNPSWQVDAYVEAAQFAGSWLPALSYWNREVMRALEDQRSRSADELRDVEQRVRGARAIVHSEELCRLQSHRRFLDELLESSGVKALEEDLDEQLRSVELLREAQENSDRNFMLAVLTVFGVLNLSTLIGVFEVGHKQTLSPERTVWYLLGIQGIILVLAIVWIARLTLKRWRRRRAG